MAQPSPLPPTPPPSTSSSSSSSAPATPPSSQASNKRKNIRPTREQIESIEKTAIALGFDLTNDSTVLAEVGRQVYQELQDTTLTDKGWSANKTAKYLRNKYNKKRKKNEDEVEVAEDEVEEVAEDEVEVAARVPPGEITGTV